MVVTAILSGHMSVTLGETELELSADQIAFTNAGQNHSGRGRQVEFVSVGIDPAMIAEAMAEIGQIYKSTEICFRTPAGTDEAISAAARLIAAEVSSDKLGQAAMLDALGHQLAVHLLRSHISVRRSPSIELSRVGPVDRRLRRAIEFMHDNYSRELNLGEIAAAAYLSEYHFAHLFKRITGLTPHVYLANLRIERARELLLQTALPISEIAATVGYQSQSHFTKVFKSVTGVTPRAFRNGG
jgi:AraC family transcriptional regulator